MKLVTILKLKNKVAKRCPESHPAHLLRCEELEFHEGDCYAHQPECSNFAGEKVTWRRRNLHAIELGEEAAA